MMFFVYKNITIRYFKPQTRPKLILNSLLSKNVYNRRMTQKDTTVID